MLRPATETAHVLMTDRIGYSKQSLESKSELDRELLQAVRECPVLEGLNDDQVLRLDSSDGISLVFFVDPVTAAEAALYLHHRVAAQAQVKLRIGLHSGLVTRREDANDKINVTGPGIEKAQRVMSLATGEQILISEYFAENLRAFEGWTDCIELIGDKEVKHGEVIRVHALNRKPVEIASDAPKVAIVYRRRAQPDDAILAYLEKEFSQSGFRVFVDRHLKVGEDWAREIERQLRGADAVVVLASDAASMSEMVLAELEIALSQQEQTGKPAVLPVRIGVDAPLEGDIGPLLNRFQYHSWLGPQDDRTLFEQLKRSILEPPEAPSGEPIAPLERPGGAVPLDSPYYIARPTDKDFFDAILRGDSIVLVKGARQMGKTSLLARGLQRARESGARVVLTDFQTFSGSQLESDERLFKSLAHMVASQVGLKIDLNENWNEWLGANSNLETILQDQILPNIDSPIIWAMDEVDRLFARPFATDFFGLIRSWHNRRALEPNGPWAKLTIAIAYATEAHLFITDLNQSPFNVGTRLALSDFSDEQLTELNRRYGNPLHGPDEVKRFHVLTGGQPYLSRCGLDYMMRNEKTFGELEAVADQEEGPFGDHLRRILVGISSDDQVRTAISTLLSGSEITQSDVFYRLRAAGVLQGGAPSEATFRCQLYRSYLMRHVG